MQLSVIRAKIDTDGVDISGENVVMAAGTTHIVRTRDLPYYQQHSDAFEVVSATPALLLTDDDNNVLGLEAPDGSGTAAFFGPLVDGTWMKFSHFIRVRLTGTGTVTLDAKNALGQITTNVESYTITNATNQIEFPYIGDDATYVRATLTGTATVEVI